MDLGVEKNVIIAGKMDGGNEYEQKQDVSSLFEPVLDDITRMGVAGNS